jgi:hypothetical protein
MISDAVKWLERDLREVVRSYFQPLRSIGRDIGAALTQDDGATGAAQVLYRTETLDDRKPAQSRYEKATIRFYIRSLPLTVCFISMAGLVEVLFSSIHRTTFAISPLQFKILVINGAVLAIGCGLGLLVTIVEGVSHLSRRWGNITDAQTTDRSRPKTPAINFSKAFPDLHPLWPRGESGLRAPRP